jgi:hypothetical protein
MGHRNSMHTHTLDEYLGKRTLSLSIADRKIKKRSKLSITGVLSLSGQLKEVFLRRVQSKLYDFLRNTALKDWEPQLRYDFVGAAIAENRAGIDAFLKDNEVTLSNINDMVEELIRTVILPYIKIR